MATTLITEDGSGLADANSYIDDVYALDFHALRSNEQWLAAGEPNQWEAIVRATDYIDKRFGRLFLGERMRSEQALAWPRVDALDYDGFLLVGVPAKLQRACAEYALRALIYVVLAPDPPKPVPNQSFAVGTSQSSSQSGSGEVIYKRQRVGSLETELRYSPLSASRSQSTRQATSGIVNDFQIPAYPEADMWIEDLLVDQIARETVRA